MATRRVRFVALARQTELMETEEKEEKERLALEDSDRVAAANALERSRDKLSEAGGKGEGAERAERADWPGGVLEKRMAGRVRALMVMWQQQEFRVAVHLLGIGIALLLVFLILSSGATFSVF